jgi:CubicO group peptidase (beta-lactamase class C family)
MGRASSTHRPVGDYLPSLRIDGATRPLTAHDLLTRSGRLARGSLFPGDPAFRPARRGARHRFHYCNMAFRRSATCSQLDGRPLSACFRARILDRHEFDPNR